MTNAAKNSMMVGGDRAPLYNRVDKILNHKQQAISKVADNAAREKKQKEIKEQHLPLKGSEKLIQAKEKKKRE